MERTISKVCAYCGGEFDVYPDRQVGLLGQGGYIETESDSYCCDECETKAQNKGGGIMKLKDMTNKELVQALGDVFLEIGNAAVEPDTDKLAESLIKASKIQDEVDRRLKEAA